MQTTESITKGIFQQEKALWSFDYHGDPKAPHPEWTGGRCADGYTNSRLVLSDPRHVETLAGMIVRKYKKEFSRMPGWIIGSSYAGITFSYEVARQFCARHGFVKKSIMDPKGFVWDELTIPRGAIVLQCEELIATMGTASRVRKAVVEGNKYSVAFLSQVLTIFHYPDISIPGKLYAFSLAERTGIKTWPREDCPLCQQGSPRLRPAQHWAELTGQR